MIIVHVEVEGRDRRSLPQRMFEYYSLLYSRSEHCLWPWSCCLKLVGMEILLRLLRHKFGPLPEQATLALYQ